MLERGLLLLLFLLPWQTIWLIKERFLNSAKWEYGTLGFYATEGLLWVCAIIFIFWYWQRAKLQATSYQLQATKDRLFIFASLLFTLYALLSALWALDQSLAFQQALRVMEALILFFMLLLGPLSWQTAAQWFVAGATLQSILGIGQFLSQSTIAVKWLGLVSHPAWEAGVSVIVNEGGRWLRAYGALPHPNILGGYLLISIILTFLLIQQLTTNNQRSRVSLVTYHLSLVTQTAALFFTFSRSAWLAWFIPVVSLLIYFCLNKGYKLPVTDYRSFLSPIAYRLSLIAASIATFTVLSIVFFPLVLTRLIGASANEFTSADERISGYTEAWELFKRSPWLGVGPGHYTLAAYALVPNRPGWEYQPVHNVPLLMLVELGVVGMATLGAVMAAAIGLMGPTRPIRNPFLFSLFFFLPLLFFDHYLYSTYIGLALMSICLALLWRQSPNHQNT